MAVLVIQGLRKSPVNRFKLWHTVNHACLPGHCHLGQRLRHRFTAIHTLLACGNADSQLWQVRITLFLAQFTIWFTLFGRESARVVKSWQTSPFPHNTSPNPFSTPNRASVSCLVSSASSPPRGCNLSLVCHVRICHIVVSFFLITFQLTFFITHTDHLSFCRFWAGQTSFEVSVDKPMNPRARTP